MIKAANNIAYSYLRFSNVEQIKGDSIRRQTQLSQAYAARNRLTIDDSLHLRDLGISAFKGKNVTQGALGAFLRAIEDGRVQPGSTLIVESLDRLSRNKIDEALSLFLGILRRGVSIVTLSPERQYSETSIGDITGLLEPLIVMARANEESAMKSSRHKANWEQKRKIVSDRKLTRACPAWLELSRDRKRFEVIEDAARVVKQIFRWVIDGNGTTAISKMLNDQRVPTIGRRVNSTTWHKSYVVKILHSRAVLGEWQPHVMQDGKRVPLGDPLPDYFPAIIKEADFYKAQQALKSRRHQTSGTKGDFVNLLTGLVFDANDGSSMVLVNKGTRSAGRSLVSSAAIRGEPGAVYLSIPYISIERAVLGWQSELQLADVVPDKTNAGLIEDVNHLEGKAAKLDIKIDTVNRQLRSDDDDSDSFETLVELLKKLQRDRKQVAQALDAKKTELNNIVGSKNLENTQSLIKRLETLKGDKLHDLRIRLRAQLNLMVKRITCQVIALKHPKRGAKLTIELTNGKRFKIDAMP